MKLSIFIGAVVGLVVSIVHLLAVSFYKDAIEKTERISRQFVQTCEATGGKPAWNYKHWECLK